jgi:endonuclease-3
MKTRKHRFCAMNIKEKAIIFAEFLEKEYPTARCSLNYKNTFELLVATILSAQCTDERVNKVCKNLFGKYKSIKDFALADVQELANDIKSTGLYKNKATNIVKMSNQILNNFGGKVPDNMGDLLQLAGVGRKTANVILGNCFDIYGIVVDTHMKRIAKRIGLTKETNPEKIEYDLLKIVPKNFLKNFSHQVINFGREICKAKKPECSRCKIANICDYYIKEIK